MRTFTLSQARDCLSSLLEEVVSQGVPISITTENREAILLSKEEWDGIQATIALNEVPGLISSIQEAALEPLESCISLDSLEW
jgi:antitoxin YefM